jgi:hypothetical protein
MASFALITEGMTDQVAISAILYGLYGDDADVREVQPLRDATDEARQGNRAGWEKVFEYCARQEFAAVFASNDYAIIQVDTDVCGHLNFPIDVTDEHGDRSPAAIVADVKTFIDAKIAPAILAAYGNRILYAISVHSLECWLLPLYATTNTDSRRTKNCEAHLTRVLNRKDMAFKKDYRTFTTLAKPFEKRAAIARARQHNDSLNLFVESLPN